MKTAAIIVAGGSGTRMGMPIKKQYLKIKGKEILAHTVGAFENHQGIDEIIVVTGEAEVQHVLEMLQCQYPTRKLKCVVAGGKERQHSVANGLEAVSDTITHVMVHDGARPLVGQQLISDCLEKAYETGASVAGVPVKDTIKQVNAQREVITTPPRHTLWSVQTPQTFEKTLIKRAYEEASAKQIVATDDSMLVEVLGHCVYMVQGSYTNIKITTPEDLVIAEQLL